MTGSVAVTFEFETRPPQTWRGTVSGPGARALVSRAVVVAKKALKPRNWTSLVVCILERGDAEDAA